MASLRSHLAGIRPALTLAAGAGFPGSQAALDSRFRTGSVVQTNAPPGVMLQPRGALADDPFETQACAGFNVVEPLKKQ